LRSFQGICGQADSTRSRWPGPVSFPGSPPEKCQTFHAWRLWTRLEPPR
jgi:hypothetical protein